MNRKNKKRRKPSKAIPFDVVVLVLVGGLILFLIAASKWMCSRNNKENELEPLTIEQVILQ